MFKCQTISIALFISVAICCASPAKLDGLNSKVLGRQEIAEEQQTPYPPAGIRPAIPFNLPTDAKLVAPVNYYLPPLFEAANFAEASGPPAKTYGPPEEEVKDNAEQTTEDVPVQSGEAQEKSDQPEDIEANEVREEAKTQSEESLQEAKKDDVEVKDESSVSAEGQNDAAPARLLARRTSGKKAARLRSAKLQVLPLEPIGVQPVYLVNGRLYALLRT